MKENQNGPLRHSNSFGRDVNPLALAAKELYQLNAYGSKTDPFEFEAKARDEPWNSELVDDFAEHNKNGILISTEKDDQNAILCHPSDHADLSISDTDTEESDKITKSQELERSVIAEGFTHGRENNSRDSDLPCIAASDLFESGKNIYTDKNIKECEVPQLFTCYKEINYHVVKDICVDEGMLLTEDKVLIESIKDDNAGLCFHLCPNDDRHCKTKKGGVKELQIPDVLTDLSLENANECGGGDYGTKIDRDDKFLLPIESKSVSEISRNTDNVRECDPEDSKESCEPKVGAAAKVDVPEEDESFVNNRLPMQKFGTRSFLRSFLNSLNSDTNEVQQSDQISSRDAISGSHSALSTSAEPKFTAGNLLYNSKVDGGSITFNFNSPKPVDPFRINECTKNVKPQSVESEDASNHECIIAGNLSHTSQVDCTSNKFKSIGNVHEQSIDHQDRNSTSPVTTKKSTKFDYEQCFDDKDESSDASCTNGEVQSASLKDRDIGNVHGQALETQNVSEDDIGKCGSFSMTNQVQCEEGESSLVDAGLITFSGPIAYSGSLSIRSDASAASTRSFAFPILQSDWNSSPVRMAKADRRHFRRKGWRSGLLCCRF